MNDVHFDPLPNSAAEIVGKEPKGLQPSDSNSFKSYVFRFFSTGGQFIVLGGALLAVALSGLDSVHTTFSFILVVLGSAILLFGTGTQGVGSFSSTQELAKYNVSIAGGAGVMALLIGYGMVKYEPEMRRIFALESRHIQVYLDPNPGTLATNSTHEYAAEFVTSRGDSLPTMRKGRGFIVLLPFDSSSLDTPADIEGLIFLRSQAVPKPGLIPAQKINLTIPLVGELELPSSNNPYHRLKKKYEFDLTSSDPKPGQNGIVDLLTSQGKSGESSNINVSVPALNYTAE